MLAAGQAFALKRGESPTSARLSCILDQHRLKAQVKKGAIRGAANKLTVPVREMGAALAQT